MTENTSLSTYTVDSPRSTVIQKHSGTLTIDKQIIYLNFAVNILGIFGAFLIITVMRLPRFNSMPRGLPYLGLAIIDLIFCMYKMFTRIWILGFGEALGLESRIGCQIDRFLTYFLVHMDAWLLVVLTGERVVAIVKPLEVSIIVTRSKVKVIMTLMVAFFLIWDGEVSLSSGLVNQSNNFNRTIILCRRVNHYNLPPKIFSLVEMLLLGLLMGSFLPFAIILTLNAILSIQLYRMKRAQADLVTSQNEAQNETQKITVMVMAASLGFVLMTSPVVIYLMFGNRDKNDPIAMILSLIYQMNPAANFYIYFLSGSLFRHEVKKLFSTSCRLKQPEVDSFGKIITTNTNIRSNAGSE